MRLTTLLPPLLTALVHTVSAQENTTWPPYDTGNDLGVIQQPTANSNIYPGQPFPFKYLPHTTYGVVSLNISVWLLTTPPDALLHGRARGASIIQCQYLTFASTSPEVECPTELIAPDFHAYPYGVSFGAAINDLTVYLGVIDEWKGEPAQDPNNSSNVAYVQAPWLTWSWVPLCYNCTSS